jgi:uncharacterized protein
MSGHAYSHNGNCTRCGNTPRFHDARRNRHCCLYSGTRFTPFDPCLADIDIRDIARGLSGIDRFNGHHSVGHYSVAEHSVLVSKLVPAKFQKKALLHDASEGLGLGDMISSVKGGLADYKAAESVLQPAIYVKYCMTTDEPWEVKEADQRLLSAEQLLLGPNVPWLREEIAARNHEPLPPGLRIECWDRETAYIRFMDRWTELSQL